VEFGYIDLALNSELDVLKDITTRTGWSRADNIGTVAQAHHLYSTFFCKISLVQNVYFIG
jgi:hypothetical protein